MPKTLDKKNITNHTHLEMLSFIDNKKQDLVHNTDKINWFINNLDHIPDYQISAWLMAVCLNGLNDRETQDLTRAMAYSGHVLTLKRHSPETNRGFVDKHSTGGVGDKVSIILAPVLAALGFKVSKFSGRSLGHTGGTIDKLESIPGFRTNLSMKEFERQIEEHGLALAAQSLEFAPADKKLYALRDQTSTVDSIPLIAASVMSKKIAGGADIILLDVKVGSGAFMKDLAYAQKLAKQMVNIGKALKLQTKAIISNMDQPLGAAVGNSLELIESLQILDGSLKNDTYDLVIELCSSIASVSEVKDVISSGKAYVKMQEWVTAQGGDISKVAEANKPNHILECRSETDGYVKSLDALSVAKVVHELAYKAQADGSYRIDNSTGVWFHAKTATRVHPSDILFTIQGANLAELEIARETILSAYKFSTNKVRQPKLVLKKIVN